MASLARDRMLIVGAVAVLQALSALFFIADSWAEQSQGGLAILELFVSISLLTGALFSGLALRHLRAEAVRRDDALAVARGALGELIERRFSEWRLSRSEAEVALFALKGCSIAEIAELRGAAEGTVRSQLSQIYAKANVKNQSGLMAGFIDELVEPIVK